MDKMVPIVNSIVMYEVHNSEETFRQSTFCFWNACNQLKPIEYITIIKTNLNIDVIIVIALGVNVLNPLHLQYWGL